MFDATTGLPTLIAWTPTKLKGSSYTEGTINGEKTYFCDHDSLIINGDTIAFEQIQEFPNNIDAYYDKIHPKTNKKFKNKTKN